MCAECGVCGDHTVECTCEGDYKEAYQRMNQYWSKEIDMRFFHLNAKLKPLDDTASVEDLKKLWGTPIRAINENDEEVTDD